jgi:hypothetical protein
MRIPWGYLLVTAEDSSRHVALKATYGLDPFATVAIGGFAAGDKSAKYYTPYNNRRRMI